MISAGIAKRREPAREAREGHRADRPFPRGVGQIRDPMCVPEPIIPQNLLHITKDPGEVLSCDVNARACRQLAARAGRTESKMQHPKAERPSRSTYRLN